MEKTCQADAMESVNSHERLAFVVGLFHAQTLESGPCSSIAGTDLYTHNVPAQDAQDGTCYFDPTKSTVTDCSAKVGSDARFCCCGHNCPVETR